MKELIEAYDEYIQLLGDELSEASGLAAVHGWKSSRAQAGTRCRATIAALKAEVSRLSKAPNSGITAVPKPRTNCENCFAIPVCRCTPGDRWQQAPKWRKTAK